MSDSNEQQSKIFQLESELQELRSENSKLRQILAKSNVPCIYCGLTDMGECKSGFPGCARMDDLMLGD